MVTTALIYNRASFMSAHAGCFGVCMGSWVDHRSVCDRDQIGINRADQIKTNSERLRSTDQPVFSGVATFFCPTPPPPPPPPQILDPGFVFYG